MKVLVTGGAGYIGSHMIYSLIDQNKSVVSIDNLSTGNKNILPKSINLKYLNVGAGNDVTEFLIKENIKTVIHFAADVIVSESIENPIKYYTNNTLNTINFFNSCKKAGVKNIIFSSTAAVYGSNEKHILSEDMDTNPISPYGKSKLFSEKILSDICEAEKINFLIFRYFNVAGSDPKKRTGQISPNATHLIKVACETALGKRDKINIFGNDYNTKDGTCIRDYIHVWDLVDAHIKGIEYLEKGGSSKILNCGYGSGYSVIEVLAALEKITGKQLKINIAERRAGDPPIVIADNTQILKTLNWIPYFNDIEKIVNDALIWEERNMLNNKRNSNL